MISEDESKRLAESFTDIASFPPYIAFRPGGEVVLDGHFKVHHLKQIVVLMEKDRGELIDSETRNPGAQS